jgi:hypothetical protein
MFLRFVKRFFIFHRPTIPSRTEPHLYPGCRNQIHIFPLEFLRIRFHVNFLSIPGSYKKFISFRFHQPNPLRTYISLMLAIFPTQFNFPDLMNAIFYECYRSEAFPYVVFPVCYFFLLFRFKYFSRRCALENSG